MGVAAPIRSDVRLGLHAPRCVAGARPVAYRLAYEEAKRALEEQERAVSELRSRAATLIAAAAITTSFFGGQALGHRVQPAAWIAVGCFIALGFGVLAILWPRQDWEFSLSPSRLIATYIEPEAGDPLPLPMIHRDLALHMDRSASLNRKQLRGLMAVFRLAALLLVAEVTAWVVVLVDRA